MIAYKIETLADAQNLTNICDKYPFDVDVIHGVQTVDAKSILGVSSLLGKYVSVIPITDDKDAVIKLEDEIKSISCCY